jgi:hypothetical protein
MPEAYYLVWVNSYSNQAADAKAGAMLGGRMWIIWPGELVLPQPSAQIPLDVSSVVS